MTGRDCPAARYVVGVGQPGPATHLQFVQAAVKMENAPDLSLRGGRRPTWRPERAARGSALGVQSREGTHDFADDFPVIQLGAARFPRRFAPRNDNRGSIFGRRWCIPTCSCQRRSLSAATDAIGAYRFNGGRYGLHVQRRARLSAPLHRTAEGLRIIHYSFFSIHFPHAPHFSLQFTDSRHSAACLPGRRAGFPR